MGNCRLLTLLGLILGLALVSACALDDSEEDNSSPFDPYIGEYDTDMRVTQSDCNMAIGEPSLKSRLGVYERNGHLYFDGPLLLDPEMLHEMGWSDAGAPTFQVQSNGRSFLLTTDSLESNTMGGTLSLEFPGCVVKGVWTATRRP